MLKGLLFGLILLVQGVQSRPQNGSIAGRLLSSDGTPAANIRVAALPARDTPAEGPDEALLSITKTDSDGRYFLENIPPGRYYIAAGLVDTPAYFPGVTGRADATPITVRAGATLLNYDFVGLHNFKVSGRVIREDKASFDSVSAVLFGNGSPLTATILEDGSFEFENVRLGTYEAAAIDPTYNAENVNLRRVRVLVDKDVAGLQLVLPASVGVTGTVTLPFAPNGPDSSLLPRLQLSFTNAAGRLTTIDTLAEPNFVTQLFSGEWSVKAGGLPAGYAITSMTNASTDLLKQPLKITAGDSPNITITLGVSSPPPWVKVDGHLTGLGETATWPQTIRMRSQALIEPLSASVSSEGSFTFPRVLPDSYFIDTGSLFTKIVVGNADLSNLEVAIPSTKDVVGEFVRIQPGEFLMGCSAGDIVCDDDEKPVHRVRITRTFEMGKYEVTQGQWLSLMGTHPWGDDAMKDVSLPVPINWNGAQEFINRLNSRKDGYVYRFPSEAEWEYAARAGTTGPYPGGTLEDIAWYPKNSMRSLHPGGQKLPNAWGLYDMLGNVFEWTQDWYDPAYYATSPENDAAGPARRDDMTGKVGRGGGFNRPEKELRVSDRREAGPDGSGPAGGFRLVRETIH